MSEHSSKNHRYTCDVKHWKLTVHVLIWHNISMRKQAKREVQNAVLQAAMISVSKTCSRWNQLAFNSSRYRLPWVGPLSAAGQRERESDRQAERRHCLVVLTNKFQEAGKQGVSNRVLITIPVLTLDAASRPAVSITRPTASLPLCLCNNGRGLVIYA